MYTSISPSETPPGLITNDISDPYFSPRYSSAPYYSMRLFSWPISTPSSYSSFNPRFPSPALSAASALTSSSSARSPAPNLHTLTAHPPPPPPLPISIPFVKKRRQRLSSADRKAICMYHQENPSTRQEDTAARYGVERSTISKILKYKTRWLNVAEDDDACVTKQQSSKFPEIEEELVTWLSQMKQHNTPITDALIHKKAKESARNLKISNERFKAGSAWIESFKHRYIIHNGVWLGGDKSLRTACSVGATHLKGSNRSAPSLNSVPESRSETLTRRDVTITKGGDDGIELENIDPVQDTNPVSASHILDRLHFSPPPDLTSYIFRNNDRYIAGGFFGDVYRCWYCQSSPKEVAVKAFRFRFTLDGDKNVKSLKMLRRELGIWRRLKHANIVPFLGIAYGFGMMEAMSLVSLWMSNGSLHHFLEKYTEKLNLAHRLQFLLDTASGLNYLHSFPIPIVHGDLNCNNVLIDGEYTARLADFGYASLVGSIPEALTYLQRSTRRPGSLRWTAPEQIESEETFTRTTKSDIYSYGCIALQVLSGKQPWAEIREDVAVVLRIAKGDRPDRPASDTLHDLHWDLIQQCWSSAEKRPTAEAIISSIQQFLNSCPPSQPLCDILAPDQAE